MRGALLVAILLAGCTAPTEAEEPESRWSVCPQWIAGDEASFSMAFEDNGTFILEANDTLDGRMLDLYNLRVSTDDALQLRFSDEDGKRLGAVVYGPSTSTRPVVDLRGEAELDVFLTALEHGTAAAPGPLKVEVTGTGLLEVTWSPWYRVCGMLT